MAYVILIYSGAIYSMQSNLILEAVLNCQGLSMIEALTFVSFKIESWSQTPSMHDWSIDRAHYIC